MTRFDAFRHPAVWLSLYLIGAASGCQRPSATAGAPSPAAEKAAGEKAGGSAAESAADKEALPTVSVAPVRVGTATNALAATGTLAVLRDRQAALSVPVPGIIDALPVRVGENVTRGQIVLRLSTRALEGQIEQARATIRQNQIQVQQAQANALQQQGQTQSTILQAQTAVSGARATLLGAQATLAGNEAALTNARQALARQQALFKEGLVARKDVEAADLAVRSADAQVATQRQAVAAQQETVRGQQQAARATVVGRVQNVVKQQDIAIARQQLASARGALTTLENQRAQYTVRAPLSGTVTAVGASVGETVDTTTKIVTIADVSRLQLQVAIPSASAGRVTVGQAVTFTVDALPSRIFQAVIRSVGGQVDAGSATITALAQVTNPNQALRDGLFARVRLITGRRPKARLVPRAAILFDAATAAAAPPSDDVLGGAAATLLRLDAAGTVHKVPIVTGWVSGDAVEIVSGNIRTGDRIVTTGGYGLEDGAKVQVEGADTKDAQGTKEP